MEQTKAEAVIEAILFTMGESVEIAKLAEVIEEDVRTTKKILNSMAERYQQEERGRHGGKHCENIRAYRKTRGPVPHPRTGNT